MHRELPYTVHMYGTSTGDPGTRPGIPYFEDPGRVPGSPGYYCGIMSTATIRIILLTLVLFVWPSPGLRSADTLPAQLSDEAFWNLIESSSESGGSFQSENFLSNETVFQ